MDALRPFVDFMVAAYCWPNVSGIGFEWARKYSWLASNWNRSGFAFLCHNKEISSAVVNGIYSYEDDLCFGGADDVRACA